MSYLAFDEFVLLALLIPHAKEDARIVEPHPLICTHTW